MFKSHRSSLLAQSSTIVRKLTSPFAEFRKETSGVAAIEFALIAPLMIAMYFGLAEIANAISIDRKVSHSANVAGDLATQVADIPSADLDEILSATLKVLSIKDVVNVKLELASYDLDGDGNPRLLGKATLNPGAGSKLQAFDPATLDDRILNATSGVVVARIAYDFEPLKLRYFDTNLNLAETFLLKPRRSATVQIGDAIGSDISCSATSEDDVSCGGSVT